VAIANAALIISFELDGMVVVRGGMCVPSTPLELFLVLADLLTIGGVNSSSNDSAKCDDAAVVGVEIHILLVLLLPLLPGDVLSAAVANSSSSAIAMGGEILVLFLLCTALSAVVDNSSSNMAVVGGETDILLLLLRLGLVLFSVDVLSALRRLFNSFTCGAWSVVNSESVWGGMYILSAPLLVFSSFRVDAMRRLLDFFGCGAAVVLGAKLPFLDLFCLSLRSKNLLYARVPSHSCPQSTTIRYNASSTSFSLHPPKL
jgi:hypothetical protein